MRKELFEALEALCYMWDQYCGGPTGHVCMSAGENCEEVLDKYKLLKNPHAYGGDIDWEELERLRETVH